MGAKFVYIFGCLASLEIASVFVPMTFQSSYNSRIFGIGELIEDDLVYARVAAKILVPESQPQFDFFEVLSSDLAELPTRFAKFQAQFGEPISAHDKEIIVGVVEYLSTLGKKKDCYRRFLNGGSREDWQRIEQECIRGANDDLIEKWLLSVAEPSMVEDQVGVEKAKKKTGKMELQNVDETAPEVEALGKNKSSVVESFAEKSVSTDDDSINLEASHVVKTQKQLESTSEKADHLVIPKEADNVDGRHYIEGGIEAISNAVGPVVSGKNNWRAKMRQFLDMPQGIPKVVHMQNMMPNAYTTSGPPLQETSVENISTEYSIGGFEDKMQGKATMEYSSSGENDMLQGTDDTENKEQNADTTIGPASDEIEVAQNTNIIGGEKMKDTTSEEISTTKSAEDAKEADQSEATAEDPRSGESNNLSGTDDTGNKEQNADITEPASDEPEMAQNTNTIAGGKTKDTTSEISTTKSTEDAKEAYKSEAIAEDPRSGESNNLPGTDDGELKELNADTKPPASDENKAAQNTDVEGRTKGTTTGTTEDNSMKRISLAAAGYILLCGTSSTVVTWN